MSPMNTDPDYMPDRWRRIVQRIVRGEEWRAAAKAEGCSASYAAVLRTRMMKNHAVRSALESIQREARTVAVYGVVEAMAQTQKGIDLAEKNGNAMAYIKGCELRSKLSGLLVDRIVVESVDLRGALEEARTRVFTMINPMLPHDQDSATKALTAGPAPFARSPVLDD